MGCRCIPELEIHLAESLRVALGTDGYPSRLDEEIVALREEGSIQVLTAYEAAA